jgi:hypothetical protein
LLRDDSLRRTIGAAARARAVEHFTVDRAISAFDEMYTLLAAGSQVVATAGTNGAPEVVTAAPQEEVGRRESETGLRAARWRWLTLPPEEESTVVAPRPDATAQTGVDQEITQVIPAPGRSAPPDSEHTVIVPRRDRGSPGSADQEQTVIMPRLVRKFAGSPGDEQAVPLAAVNREPPEAPSELTEAKR